MADHETAADDAERAFIVAESLGFASGLLRASGRGDRVDAITDALVDRVPDSDLMSKIYMSAVETLIIEMLPRLTVTRRERDRLERLANQVSARASSLGWEPHT
jgi:hypothetical protein